MNNQQRTEHLWLDTLLQQKQLQAYVRHVVRHVSLVPESLYSLRSGAASDAKAYGPDPSSTPCPAAFAFAVSAVGETTRLDTEPANSTGSWALPKSISA